MGYNDFVNDTHEDFCKQNVNRYEESRARKARAFTTPQCSSVGLGPQIKNGGIYSRMSGLQLEKTRLPVCLT